MTSPLPKCGLSITMQQTPIVRTNNAITIQTILLIKPPPKMLIYHALIAKLLNLPHHRHRLNHKLSEYL